MKNKRVTTILIFFIVLISAAVTYIGITSSDGPGEYKYMSIRGENVSIYGKGVYKHMSSDVAVQGIAQDYVTLFIGIPLLIGGLYFSRKNSLKGRLILSGTLMYFLVTYLFYLAMAMYNILFLCYASLLGLSFFAFLLTMFSYDMKIIEAKYAPGKLLKYAGTFLVINSFMIALLWLGVVVPPLLNGSIYPKELQHYTTLIVQGFDLGLLLPIGLICGTLAIKKNSYGYLFTTINLIFLSILMAALTSKTIFMAKAGVNVIPVIFIMPTICLIAVLFSRRILKRA